MRATVPIIGLLAAFFTLGAQATVIDADTLYDLSNHPDGGAADPLSGLRLDGLLTGHTADIYTFDFEDAASSMTMLWDSATNTLTITGTAFGGEDGGSAYVSGTTEIWNITFTYNDMYVCGTGLCSNSGTGTVSSATFGSYDLIAVSGRNSYAFQLDLDHRGFAGISGWGWMNHCPSAENEGAGGACDTHLYASDWLFTAEKTPVSEPATLLLLGIALAGMGLVRRKKIRTDRRVDRA